MYVFEDQSSVMYHINFITSTVLLLSKNITLHMKQQPNISHEMEAMID
jgi:hypothetical protein